MNVAADEEKPSANILIMGKCIFRNVGKLLPYYTAPIPKE
jgi:hypothetical protein